MRSKIEARRIGTIHYTEFSSNLIINQIDLAEAKANCTTFVLMSFHFVIMINVLKFQFEESHSRKN
jgi:hypothetical protein